MVTEDKEMHSIVMRLRQMELFRRHFVTQKRAKWSKIERSLYHPKRNIPDCDFQEFHGFSKVLSKCTGRGVNKKGKPKIFLRDFVGGEAEKNIGTQAAPQTP